MNQIFTVVIVDDQKLYRETLKDYFEDHFPELKLIGEYDNPTKALAALKKQQPDVLFLDVEMPGMTGFDLLKKLKPVTFEIIFTTSHQEYSIEAIRASAMDFLVKPVKLKELKAAVERLEERLNARPTDRVQFLLDYLQKEKTQQHKDDRVGFPTRDGIVFIEPKDIVRFEASSNYSFMILKDGDKKLVTKTLKQIESILEGRNFFRLHNSHLVNLACIKKYMKAASYVVMTDGETVSVARNRKEDFLEQFSHL